MSDSAPIAQEAYAILNRFEVEVTKEESEAVDTLRYSFNKLQSKAVSTNLILLLLSDYIQKKIHFKLFKSSIYITFIALLCVYIYIYIPHPITFTVSKYTIL